MSDGVNVSQQPSDVLGAAFEHSLRLLSLRKCHKVIETRNTHCNSRSRGEARSAVPIHQLHDETCLTTKLHQPVSLVIVQVAVYTMVRQLKRHGTTRLSLTYVDIETTYTYQALAVV